MIINIPSTLPAKEVLALQAGSVAHGYIGVSRQSNRDQVAKFLAVYGLPFEDTNGPIAFCDAGAGYCWLKAFCMLTGVAFDADSAVQVFRQMLPTVSKNYWHLSPSCEETRQDAIHRGLYLPSSEVTSHTEIPANWIAFYDWKGEGVAHHVGITLKGSKSILSDTEFNTSGSTTVGGAAQETDGGCVAVKSRNTKFVMGYLRTY